MIDLQIIKYFKIYVTGILIILLVVLSPIITLAANITWSGATNTTWNTGSNWVGGSVPGSNDNASIPGGLVNYPVINSNINVRNININSTSTGGKLTITAGTTDARRVTVRANGFFIISAGTFNCTRFSVSGTATVNGGTVTSTGIVSINSGGVIAQANGVFHIGNNVNSNPSSDLRISAGGVLNQAGGTFSIRSFIVGSGTYNQSNSSAILKVDGDWQPGAGSNFNSTAGTVEFTNNGPQSDFVNGTRQFFNIIVDNNVNPGFSNLSSSTIPIKGNFTNNNNSLSNSTNSTFTFNGTGNQFVITSVNNNNPTFGNLVVNKISGTLTLQNNLNIADNISIQSGTFDLDTYKCNRSTFGGTLTASANTFLLLGGTTGGMTGSNFPGNFVTVSLATTSSVVYDGGSQTIASFNYGNLILSATTGAATKTMPSLALIVTGDFSSNIGTGTSVTYTAFSNFSVAGNFNVGTGTTFVASFYTHSIGGNFIVTGTVNSTGSKFILNGTAAQNVSSASAFSKLIIQKNAGLVNLLTNISMNDSLIFIKGNIRTTTNKVIINTTGKITGAAATTGWVFGTIQLSIATGTNITKTYDIGDSLKYSPAILNITTVTVAGGVSAQVTGTDHPLISNSTLNTIRSVNRYWTFTNNGISFNNCKITFNWLATDVDAGSTTTLFKVARYTGTWDTTAVLSPLPTSIQATGITFFGDFAIGERCGSTVAGTWTGFLSTDWSAPENWQCGLVPNSTINALISTGLIRYPVLSSATGSVKNLTIQNGASVTVSNATLQISGVISNSGAFNASNGGVEMNGTVAQVIPNGVFSTNTINDLTINNSAGVTLSGVLNVKGKLKANTGNFNTGTFLTLISDATQTALIDGSGNGEVLGNVTMQRYLPSGFGYKYFSSPFVNATVNEFSDDLNLLSTFHTFYKYNENLNSSGWVNYTAPSGTLVPLTGYAANFGNSTASKTVDITGVVNNHLQSISLKNNNKPITQGFNLVGNPFPSPVNWDAPSGLTRVNIDNAIYYFDASNTDQYGGTYSTYINGISSNGIAGNIIPPMQGFFVHVSNGTFPVTGSLQINNPARTTDLQPVFHRTASTDTRPLIRIEAGLTDLGNQKDALVIYFDNAASIDFNPETDALKLMNTDSYIPNIYSLSANGINLSINALPDDLKTNTTIPIGFKTDISGWVTFNASTLFEIPDSLKVYFVDAELRTNHDLRADPEFRINLQSGIYDERFHILFTSGELPHVTDIDEFGVYCFDGTIYMYYNPGLNSKGFISINNMQGQVLWNREVSGTGKLDIQPHFSSGIYIVNFRSDKSIFSKKILLKNE